jgi:crotonobetainyl-CoA:carnitine CoA-transferase CaiB-like acyl-CoA transferase
VTKPTKPLDRIVVIEIGGSISAPFAGQILGDLGAEVIKVERAEGDDTRHWGAPFIDGSSCSFHMTNRNKLSVVLDLRNKDDLARLKALIRDRADVVIQNMRPGLVEQLGIDAASLRAIKPGLIYCNMGAFGNSGPLADRPGYDPLLQAFSGIMSIVGEEGRSPMRVGASIVDMGTALWAVIGILAALLRRRSDGEDTGGTVDVSLFETATAWMTPFVMRYLLTGEIAKAMPSGQVGYIAPYGAYRTGDGYLMIAAGNNSLFGKLATLLGHGEWMTDERFATNELRCANRETLNALIEGELTLESTEGWHRRVETAGVPCAPVHNVAELVEHEQTRAMGLIRDLPGHVPTAQVMLPISFDGERPAPHRGVPRLGEHNDMIFP